MNSSQYRYRPFITGEMHFIWKEGHKWTKDTLGLFFQILKLHHAKRPLSFSFSGENANALSNERVIDHILRHADEETKRLVTDQGTIAYLEEKGLGDLTILLENLQGSSLKMGEIGPRQCKKADLLSLFFSSRQYILSDGPSNLLTHQELDVFASALSLHLSMERKIGLVQDTDISAWRSMAHHLYQYENGKVMKKEAGPVDVNIGQEDRGLKITLPKKDSKRSAA